MSNRGQFLVYCAEQYKLAKNITGKELSRIFSRYGIWDYIYTFYDALHTTGWNYIIDDIDGLIEDGGYLKGGITL